MGRLAAPGWYGPPAKHTLPSPWWLRLLACAMRAWGVRVGRLAALGWYEPPAKRTSPPPLVALAGPEQRPLEGDVG